MTIFTIFTWIYYIFFVGIFALALRVYFQLRRLVSQIAVTEIDKSGVNPAHYQSVDAFLLYSSSNFPLAALVKILPGTFVGFGILGTFLGFSSGISGMSLSGNVDELFGKLGVFFSGLNTAFITSIVGVVLSVLFGTILYQWPLNKIKYHCARIYSALFNPAEGAKSEFDSYTASLQEMTRTLLAAKEAIAVALTTTVEKIDVLPDKFLAVGENLEKTVAPIKETFSSMQTTLENYAKQAESLQSASEQIQQTLTKFITTSEEANARISVSLEATIGATKEIQANNAKLNDDHRKMLDDYKALHESLSSIQQKTNEEVSSYADAIKTYFTQLLSEYSEQSQKVLHEQNAQLLEERKSALEDCRKVDEKISSYADAIKTHFTQLLSEYSEQSQEILQGQNAQLLEERKAALADYQKIDENISSILETVNKNLSDYSATMEKTLVSTLEEYNKTAQKVTESFFGAKTEEEKK